MPTIGEKNSTDIETGEENSIINAITTDGEENSTEIETEENTIIDAITTIGKENSTEIETEENTIIDAITTIGKENSTEIETGEEIIITQIQQSIDRPRRRKASYPKAIIQAKLRDRENCIIPQDTFFSCADRRVITRGTNNERILTVRKTIHEDQLETNEIDVYINNLNSINKSKKMNDVIIFNTDFFTMALRHVETKEATTSEKFAMPHPKDVHTMIGELVERLPLIIPYNEDNETRCREICGHLPLKEDYKNFKKVHCSISIFIYV
jgi:hypothetical protein